MLIKHIKTLQELEKERGSKVTIYMPTHPQSAGGNFQADQIRFKNAMQQVEAKLPKHESELHDILKRLEKLYENSEFWKHQDLGLAVFATQSKLHTVKLPIEVTPYTHIDTQFLLSPLKSMQHLEFEILLLDVNLDKPRLFKVNLNSIDQIEEFNPLTMNEMLEQDHQSNQQFHAPKGDRKSTPMYHGHGGSDDHSVEETDLYTRYIVKKLYEATSATEKLPLLLAAEHRRLHQLQAKLHNFELIAPSLTGSHHHYNEQQLHSIVKSFLVQDIHDKLNQAYTNLESSKLSVFGVQEIIGALKRKAISKLFVPSLRKTKDSVRSKRSEALLLETQAISQFDALIQKTTEQGGAIQPVDIDTYKGQQLHAIRRF